MKYLLIILILLGGCASSNLKEEDGLIYLHCGITSGGPYTERYIVDFTDNFKEIKKGIKGNRYCVSSWWKVLPATDIQKYVSKEVYLYRDVVVTKIK